MLHEPVSKNGTRKEPLFVTIITAGTDTKSVCCEQYQYAKKVHDGLIRYCAGMADLSAAEVL